MRKRLLLVLSVAMLGGGVYLLATELLWVDQRNGLTVLMGLMLVAFGAYLLWADFVAPGLGIKTKQ
jgi:hypothetical protein